MCRPEASVISSRETRLGPNVRCGFAAALSAPPNRYNTLRTFGRPTRPFLPTRHTDNNS